MNIKIRIMKKKKIIERLFASIKADDENEFISESCCRNISFNMEDIS